MTLKKALINVILAVLCALFQFTFTFFRPFGTAPALLFCLTAVIAVFEESLSVSVGFALLCGLLTDFLSGGYFGFYTIFFVLTAWFGSYFVTRVFSKNIGSAIAVYGICLTAIKLVNSVLHIFLQKSFSFTEALLYDFLPVILISLPVFILFYVFYSFAYVDKISKGRRTVAEGRSILR